jgi:hypothetical protein
MPRIKDQKPPKFAHSVRKIPKSHSPLRQLLKARKQRERQEPLGERDPVLQCLESMRKRKKQWGRSLLVNGQIEMQLKYFIGQAWERLSTRNAYVMDKQFHSSASNEMPGGEKKKGNGTATKGGRDLLALKGTKAKFWIETKCSFFEDHSRGQGSAIKALSQADQTKGNLIPILRTCPVYIVHFLNSMPTARFPPFVLKRYQRFTKRAKRFQERHRMTARLFRECQLEWLRSIYAGHRGGDARRNYDCSAVIELSKRPVLKALVVKLK